MAGARVVLKLPDWEVGWGGEGRIERVWLGLQVVAWLGLGVMRRQQT